MLETNSEKLFLDVQLLFECFIVACWEISLVAWCPCISKRWSLNFVTCVLCSKKIMFGNRKKLDYISIHTLESFKSVFGN